MGLLDKANNTHIKSESPLGSSFSRLISDIKALSSSVDYSTQIFRLICNHFSIEKAVLFFKSDEINNFISLCSSGYDITTNNRLRLDRNFFLDERIAANLSLGEPFCLDNPSPLLKDFFSLREYGLIDEMCFVPVFQEDELIALFVITEWNEFIPEDWTRDFREISETVSLPLLKSRRSLVNSDIKYDEDESPDQENTLRKILASEVKDDLYLIELNLSSLFKDLLSEKSGLTALNIKKEILSVFKTMSGGNVNIMELQNSRILLIQNKFRIPDIDLYMYQLAASLPLLYSSLDSAPDLHPVIREYSKNSDIEVIIKDLI